MKTRSIHRFTLIIGVLTIYSSSHAMHTYRHEELVKARQLWLGAEKWVALYMRELSDTHHTIPCTYTSGSRHIAVLDPVTQMVTTSISAGQTICLNYTEFECFMYDKTLYQHAYDHYRQENQPDVRQFTLGRATARVFNNPFFLIGFVVGMNVTLMSIDYYNAFYG